jgi:hypothetical protein
MNAGPALFEDYSRNLFSRELSIRNEVFLCCSSRVWLSSRTSLINFTGSISLLARSASNFQSVVRGVFSRSLLSSMILLWLHSHFQMRFCTKRRTLLSRDSVSEGNNLRGSPQADAPSTCGRVLGKMAEDRAIARLCEAPNSRGPPNSRLRGSRRFLLRCGKSELSWNRLPACRNIRGVRGGWTCPNRHPGPGSTTRH